MVRGIQASTTVPPTVALQVFTIGTGIVGGVAGMILAKEFAGVKDIPARLVIGTTLVGIIALLGAGLYLAKKAKEGVI